MKKWLFFFFASMVLMTTYAQQAELQVVATSGGSSQSVPGYTIDYTIGETIILSVGTDPFWTHGFLQPLSSSIELPGMPLIFRGTAKDAFIQLNWTTATETNNYMFYVERSADGTTFTTIDSVFSKAPNGYSTIALSYQYADVKPMAGPNYYRLRQRQKSDIISYSDTIQVNFTREDWWVRIYPNPVLHDMHIDLSTDRETTAMIYITSTVGQKVFEKFIQVPFGYSTKTLPLVNLASGVYVVFVHELNTGRQLKMKLVKE